MQLGDLMAPFVFLGEEHLARAIYEHLREGLTDLERYALLHYLGISKPDEARRAWNAAGAPEREAARRAVMAKFPREWPPPVPEGRGQQKYKKGQIHHDAEFGDIKVG